MNNEKNKSFAVIKSKVSDSYQEIFDKKGSVGIDTKIIECSIKTLSVSFAKSGITWFRAAIGKHRKGKSSSFMLTAIAASNFTSNHIDSDQDHNRTGSADDGDRDRIKHGERHDASYTFGVLVDYNIKKGWSLQSGVLVSSNSIHIDPKTIYAVADDQGGVKYLYSCASGYTFLSPKLATNPSVGDSIQANTGSSDLQYITIPLSVKYRYPLYKKIGLVTSLGASINILTSGKLHTLIENGANQDLQVIKLQGLKPTYLNGVISFGTTYNLSRKIELVFMPYYNFALTSGTDGVPVKTYPNAFSIAAGLSYKF